MDKTQRDALFALLDAFPQERHWVDENGMLRFEIQLTEEQHQFWLGAQRMMEPAEEEGK